MANPEQRQFDLFSTYVHLEDRGAATPIEVGPQFWQRDVGRYEDGRLMFAYHFEKDADHWEVHPEGEELVCVLSGAVDFVLEEPGGERTVALRGGDSYLVPRGVWHRQIVRTPGDLLFVTPGKGTKHRPR
jgi:mannose-6-phosphate isomerase-like protein (cupin superfamily)